MYIKVFFGKKIALFVLYVKFCNKPPKIWQFFNELQFNIHVNEFMEGVV